jgi:hypothetical protein
MVLCFIRDLSFQDRITPFTSLPAIICRIYGFELLSGHLRSAPADARVDECDSAAQGAAELLGPRVCDSHVDEKPKHDESAVF